ncbi:GrpB family protein [Rossellomorea sp. BNER]|uniref:GrpB family protein n=1 Tax=Rossellomorea sp. BNER TaxID=2962031 RepID=UPI003AF20ECC|nr:GrpB family protein [Rossellomorea sp. BNER]
MRKVEVLPYQSEWKVRYQKEKNRILNLLKNVSITIHHVGSTSVEGLAAKPIIDILVELPTLESLNPHIDEFVKSGYVLKGENGIPNRRYFQFEKDGTRLVHLHMYQKGNHEIHRHIAFRDYLREFPKEAKQYGNIKQELAKRFPLDIASYIMGKDEFVKAMEKKALAWNQTKEKG